MSLSSMCAEEHHPALGDFAQQASDVPKFLSAAARASIPKGPQISMVRRTVTAGCPVDPLGGPFCPLLFFTQPSRLSLLSS